MKRDFITERQFITVTLRSNEWADIERLLERGHDDLSHYLEHGDPVEDDIEPEAVEELERLSQGSVSSELERRLSAARQGSPWSVDDEAAASREGWNLFRADGSQLASSFWDIEREDEQDPAVFQDDTEALKHVMQQADTGSELHCRALGLYMTIAD